MNERDVCVQYLINLAEPDWCISPASNERCHALLVAVDLPHQGPLATGTCRSDAKHAAAAGEVQWTALLSLSLSHLRLASRQSDRTSSGRLDPVPTCLHSLVHD